MKETVASYYGQPGRDRFYGRQTASGERLTYPSDSGYPTVAHKTLPFGTLVRFLNPMTGVELTARVNDRGPFIAGREFDLSFEAATALGTVEQGVARLLYDIISPREDAARPRAPRARGGWTVGQALAWIVQRVRYRAWDAESWMPDIDVAAEAARTPDLMPPTPLDPGSFSGLPVHGRISSHFGPRWGRTHYGLDIAAPTGSPVWATAPGKVVSAGWRRGYGLTVVVAHAGGVQTLYGHMDSINVLAGAEVEAGTVLGACGSTGHSTGPHVHYGVLKGGRFVDPLEAARP